MCLASFPLERLSWPWRARGGRLRAQPIQAMSIAEERAVDARRAALPRPLSSCMPTGGDLTLANLAELRLRGGSSVPGLGAGPAGGLWAAERDQGILAWQLAAAATGPSWVRAGDLAACMAGGLAGGLAGCDAGGATAGLAGWRPQAAAEQHAEAPGGRDLQGAAAALAAWNGGRALVQGHWLLELPPTVSLLSAAWARASRRTPGPWKPAATRNSRARSSALLPQTAACRLHRPRAGTRRPCRVTCTATGSLLCRARTGAAQAAPAPVSLRKCEQGLRRVLATARATCRATKLQPPPPR